jgi:hypothetical protein
MKEIKLTQGKVTIVDDTDYDDLMQYKWQFDRYAYRTIKVGNKKRSLRMHRYLIKDVPDGMVIDHINRDKLDNRRCNLRITTQSVNCFNSAVPCNKKSDAPKGIYYDNERKKWVAMSTVNYHKKNIGRFNSKEDAILAYNEYVKEHRKEGDFGAMPSLQS